MRLQKPSRGLSNVLGLFEGGEVPLVFGSTVVPVIDSEQYLLEKRVYRRTVNGAGTQVIQMELEPGFRYKMHWMGIEVDSTVPATQVFGFAPIIRDGVTLMGIGEDFGNLTATSIFRTGMSLDGMVLGFDLDTQGIGYAVGTAAAAVNYELIVFYERYAI